MVKNVHSKLEHARINPELQARNVQKMLVTDSNLSLLTESLWSKAATLLGRVLIQR